MEDAASADRPPITVVVATRDRREELGRTLHRLTRLRPAPPIIVVDNASSDGTSAYVRAEFPGVDVRTLADNRGCAARNLGVALARTPYVAFSDDDSWWAGDALHRAADALDAHPDVGLIAASTFVGEEGRPDPINEQLSTGLRPAPAGLPGPRVLGFLACAAIVRKQAFIDAGGFSDLLFFVGEEALLAQDLAAAGWELCHLEDVHAHHHPSDQRPPSAWRRRLERRNTVLGHVLRRPLHRAAAETLRLAREAATVPEARPALRDVLRDTPRAMLSRRRLPPAVETDLQTLEAV